ncbi:hypothetical protein EV426DRAFT_574717 [Tirmania nivea]|nr:hypothetical protein EV426DRAFT_577438 [Tirmania nivea]KAF8423031.1 hypothetical protein EV426DRAFT_574717 [Tirmania nivea]
MSAEAMMPISADALHYRTILFELSKPVTISPQIFDKIWPYVDSVYSKLQQELLQAYGTVRVQKYECRLRKSKKSSMARVADSDGKVIKHRQSSIRNADLCNVRIKDSRPVDAYELIDQLNLDDNTVQSQRMEEWANHVQVTLNSLTSVRAEDIVNRHRPWEL